MSCNKNSVHNQDACFNEPIKLPKELRGYVRYVVVLHPEDHKPYSIGIRFICNTEGAQGLLAYLLRNVNRKHKKHVHSWLCQFVVDGCPCPLNIHCPNIHVTPEGYNGRRNWLRPLKGSSMAADDQDDEEDAATCFSIETDTSMDSLTTSPTKSLPSSSLCSSPQIFRPISPILQPSVSPTEDLNHLHAEPCLLGNNVLTPARLNIALAAVPTPNVPSSRVNSEDKNWLAFHHSAAKVQKDLPWQLRQEHADHSRECPDPWLTASCMVVQESRSPSTLINPHVHAPYGINVALNKDGSIPQPSPMSVVEPQHHDEVLCMERLGKTRAKLHNAVDWILSRNDRNYARDICNSTFAEQNMLISCTPIAGIEYQRVR